MGLGMKSGAQCEQIEDRELWKGQEDESENFGEYFLCPFAGIQKGHREHLLNYARIKDENSSKHTLKQIPLLQTKAPSVTSGEKYFRTSIFG